MTRANVTLWLASTVLHATEIQPAPAKRKISPHTIHHSTATHLLQRDVDINVIALWLGHESPVQRATLLKPTLQWRKRGLAKLNEHSAKILRYRAPDSPLNFLRPT